MLDENTELQNKEELLPEILLFLTRGQPKQVTYKQIEAALVGAGLDPFEDEDEYLWLVEEVEQRNILVVDQISSTEDILADLEQEADADAQEVKAVLAQIYDDLKGEEANHLLTSEEQRRLLEVFQIGKQAKIDLLNAATDAIAQSLLEQIHAADNALELLLQRNLRLVASIVLKYGRGAKHLEIEDLIQEGMIGFQVAINKFDLDQGTRLSTYGTWWIRQAVSRAIADQDRVIRLPVHLVEKINEYHKAYNSLLSTLDRAPTNVELAVELNLLSPKVANAIRVLEEHKQTVPYDLLYQKEQAVKQIEKVRLRAETIVISLNQTTTSSDEATEIGELIPCASTETPEDIVLRHHLTEVIDELLTDLAERERDVIIARFGLDGGEPKTLEEIGKEYNVTRERIRQIEAKAIRRLQHPTRSKKIRSFWGEPKQ